MSIERHTRPLSVPGTQNSMAAKGGYQLRCWWRSWWIHPAVCNHSTTEEAQQMFFVVTCWMRVKLRFETLPCLHRPTPESQTKDQCQLVVIRCLRCLVWPQCSSQCVIFYSTSGESGCVIKVATRSATNGPGAVPTDRNLNQDWEGLNKIRLSWWNGSQSQ